MMIALMADDHHMSIMINHFLDELKILFFKASNVFICLRLGKLMACKFTLVGTGPHRVAGVQKLYILL